MPGLPVRKPAKSRVDCSDLLLKHAKDILFVRE